MFFFLHRKGGQLSTKCEPKRRRLWSHNVNILCPKFGPHVLFWNSLQFFPSIQSYLKWNQTLCAIKRMTSLLDASPWLVVVILDTRPKWHIFTWKGHKGFDDNKPVDTPARVTRHFDVVLWQLVMWKIKFGPFKYCHVFLNIKRNTDYVNTGVLNFRS